MERRRKDCCISDRNGPLSWSLLAPEAAAQLRPRPNSAVRRGPKEKSTIAVNETEKRVIHQVAGEDSSGKDQGQREADGSFRDACRCERPVAACGRPRRTLRVRLEAAAGERDRLIRSQAARHKLPARAPPSLALAAMASPERGLTHGYGPSSRRASYKKRGEVHDTWAPAPRVARGTVHSSSAVHDSRFTIVERSVNQLSNLSPLT